MIFTVLVITTMLILLAAYSYYLKIFRLLHNIVHPANQKKVTIADTQPERKSFKILTPDRFELVGYAVEAKEETKGIIVVCHNLAGCKEGMWRYVKFLHEAGYRVVSFDFRDHGESTKSRKIRFNHEKDLKSVMDYVFDHNKDHLPVGLFALSMGSIAAMLYAAKDSRIKVIVAEGGPLLYKDDYFQYIASIHKIHNRLNRALFIRCCLLITDISKIEKGITKALSSLRDRSIFFIQGQRDFINPPKNTAKALEILHSTRAKCWNIEGANHLTGYYTAGKEYQYRVLNFFDENLFVKDPLRF